MLLKCKLNYVLFGYSKAPIDEAENIWVKVAFSSVTSHNSSLVIRNMNEKGTHMTIRINNCN